jgi:hypothetical protein
VPAAVEAERSELEGAFNTKFQLCEVRPLPTPPGQHTCVPCRALAVNVACVSSQNQGPLGSF